MWLFLLVSAAAVIYDVVLLRKEHTRRDRRMYSAGMALALLFGLAFYLGLRETSLFSLLFR